MRNLFTKLSNMDEKIEIIQENLGRMVEKTGSLVLIRANW